MKTEPSSASTTSSTMIECWKCETPNPRDRKFCGDCGAPLWAKCEKCDEPYAAGEKFCGSCGAGLLAHVQALQSQAQEKLKLAVSQMKSGDYDTAISTVAPVLRMNHPGVAKQLAKAEELRELCNESRRRSNDVATAKLKLAKSANDAFEFEKAVALLEQIPASVRTDEVEEKIASLKAKTAEIKSLVAYLNKAGDQKQYDGVFSQINRLLRLSPDHPAAIAAAEKTVRYIYAISGKLKAKRRYNEAVGLLSQISDRFAPDAAKSRLEKLRELQQLHSELKTADTATRALANVAARLHELEPETKADLVHEKIATKRKAFKKLGDPAWWSPESKPYLNTTVKLFHGFAPLAVGPAFAFKTLAAHSSAFLPAIGVALQQLGAGSIAMNLTKPTGGLLSKLAFFGSGKTKSAIGVDIGKSAMKAVRLSSAEDNIVVDDVAYFQFSDTVDSAQRAIEIDNALDQLAAAFSIESQPLALVMPSQMALTRFFSLPQMPEKKLNEAIAFEIENQTPFPADQIYASHQLITPPPSEDEPSTCDIVAIIAKNENIEQQLSPVLKRKWKVDILQSDIMAIANFHSYRVSLNEAASQEAIAWLDVGNTSRMIVANARGPLWMRNLPVGGRDATQALAKSLRYTTSQAEEQKRTMPADAALADALRTLESVHEKLAAEVLRSLDQFNKEHRNESIAELRVVGDAARTHGLTRVLRTGPKASELGWGEKL